MKRKTLDIILIIILTLTVIAASGASIAFHSLTIIDWWKPALICGVLSLPVTLYIAKYMARLTGPIMKYIEYPAAFLLTFSIMMATFYSINYGLSDHSSGYEYHAPVVNKYSEVRKRSHKTGRRGYREEKYTVYVIELEMKDGRIKKMEKPLSEYNRIKKGGTVRLFIEDGLFRIPVIKMNKKTT